MSIEHSCCKEESLEAGTGSAGVVSDAVDFVDSERLKNKYFVLFIDIIKIGLKISRLGE